MHTITCTIVSTFLEQVASGSKVGSIGLKSYTRVLIHEEQLLTVSVDSLHTSLSTPLSTLSVCAYRIVPPYFGVVGEGHSCSVRDHE